MYAIEDNELDRFLLVDCKRNKYKIVNKYGAELITNGFNDKIAYISEDIVLVKDKNKTAKWKLGYLGMPVCIEGCH